MIKSTFIFMTAFILCLSTGCDDDSDLSLCPDYIENISDNRYQGFIELTENNTSYQTPVTVDIFLSNNDIDLVINNGSQNLYTATHRYNCTLIESGTLPFIEILDTDSNIIGCITGTPTSTLNYDLEVIPNATNTVASFSF
jgi:hypothetical protein